LALAFRAARGGALAFPLRTVGRPFRLREVARLPPARADLPVSRLA
jgi:hypothetical protein